ncbi:hypothetical protein N7468_010579 [Penicillium chermesinum]|uniref:Transmembrane protein n=1 Tax=Penicillium chermesinum TaxID=63820 RepID=A0A9W9N7X1_9EURO|nr:uncharacterized protein N7468_010579 [Penicillium chermesinum]KAJ5214900.1 hypothetical protein N7468_010579 [Penicillium chermesinum]
MRDLHSGLSNGLKTRDNKTKAPIDRMVARGTRNNRDTWAGDLGMWKVRGAAVQDKAKYTKNTKQYKNCFRVRSFRVGLVALAMHFLTFLLGPALHLEIDEVTPH